MTLPTCSNPASTDPEASGQPTNWISAEEVRRRTARLVHDLRSPLHGIVGAASLLRSAHARGGPLNLDQMLDIVDASARHLLSLVDGLIDPVCIEGGAVASPAPLAPLLQRCLQIVEPNARHKGLTLELDLDPALEHLPLRLDVVRMRRVLVNLLGNAVRFTDRGAVRLSARAEPSPDGSCALRIEVVDSGEGMFDHQLSAVLAALLGRATRLPPATVRRGGSGLGLPLTDQMLRAMGSRLQLTSMAGAGTRAWFVLFV